jgi:hypothetical protein
MIVVLPPQVSMVLPPQVIVVLPPVEENRPQAKTDWPLPEVMV